MFESRQVSEARMFAVGMLGALVFASPPAVSAQVSCGDVIPSGSKITLEGNLEVCETSHGAAALTVIGPATLDLNEFTVECTGSDLPDGIVLEGRKAKLLNGTILQCARGVVLAGEGKHRVERVVSGAHRGGTVSGGRAHGFDVLSDGNKLTRNFSADNESGDGFKVDGNKNTLTENTAQTNLDGFDVDGAGNKLTRNVAVRNEVDGFVTDGAKNQLKENIAAVNGDDGYEAGAAIANKLSKNVALVNADEGFRIGGGSHKVEKNIAAGSTGGPEDPADGIAIHSDGTQVKRNLSVNNPFMGIRMGGGRTGNTVKQNFALGNTIVDLGDANTDCVGNSWSKNEFMTSDADGASNPPCIE